MSASAAYWKSKRHDKEAAKDLMLSMDTTNDEKRKFVNVLEACNISEESLDVEDEYITRCWRFVTYVESMVAVGQ